MKQLLIEVIMGSSRIKIKYYNKKRDSLKRGISFELSLEEYKVLRSFRESTCDYTGIVFSKEGQNAASIERIDKKVGYVLSNCCMVTRRANILKDIIIDEKGTTRLSLQDLETMKIIKEKLKNPEKLSEKYVKACYGATLSEGSKEKITHPDLDISISYIKFAEKANVSFSHYKKLLLRKTCSITRIPLGVEKSNKRVLITSDGSSEFTDSNTIVVARSVANILNTSLDNDKLQMVLNHKNKYKFI
jgi:hypothetical protein